MTRRWIRLSQLREQITMKMIHDMRRHRKQNGSRFRFDEPPQSNHPHHRVDHEEPSSDEDNDGEDQSIFDAIMKIKSLKRDILAS